ncbi:MAG: UbiA family prenyltransferase [Nevskia sp.]|nr:UbiA family prenyltransferase [Nevskia sp.]
MLQHLRDYILLMRLNRPIGLWLVLWPTLWALWLAAGNVPPLDVLAAFALGTVLMRSAACVIEAYANRDLAGADGEDTDRPIAAGRIQPREALLLFALLCASALAAARNLNGLALALSLPAVLLASAYPFIKRLHSLPQAHLGIAFSWGIPTAYAAVRNTVPWTQVAMMMAATVCWAIAYDTYYAMSREPRAADDDTNRLPFGRDPAFVGLLQLAALALLWFVGVQAERGAVFDLGLIAAAAFALQQQHATRTLDRRACLQAFINNNGFGVAIFMGLVWDYTLTGLAATDAFNQAAVNLQEMLPADTCTDPLPTRQGGASVPDYGYCVERDITYTPHGWSHPMQLDVFTPRRETVSPVVLLFHGGHWQFGRRHLMEAVATTLARRGYVAVNVSYRLAPMSRFPAQLQDAQAAARWLRSNAVRLNADPFRMGVWGFSSGAHIGAMLAMIAPDDPWGAPDLRVRAVVGGGTPTDLTRFNPVDGMALFGVTFEQDPDLYRHASPLYQVSKRAPPTFLYHGRDDTEVPLEQALWLKTALADAGVPVELNVLRGVGHAGVTEAAIEPAIGFLDRTLKP